MLRERTGPQITGQAALACLRWPARVLGLLDGQEGSWWQVSYQEVTGTALNGSLSSVKRSVLTEMRRHRRLAKAIDRYGCGESGGSEVLRTGVPAPGKRLLTVVPNMHANRSWPVCVCKAAERVSLCCWLRWSMPDRDTPSGTAAHFPPVIVWSHGRSGSTLLLDLLASDPQTWSAFEPLQEIRQRPHDAWAFNLDGQQSCRDRKDDSGGKGDGASTLASSCPLRDASVLLALLRCNQMPLLATWYGELDLTGQRAAFLPERLVGSQLGRGAAWLPTPYFGRSSDARAEGVIFDERACLARPGRLAKTIRLNGHLDAIFNVSRALGWSSPLILHLVRDPRAIYASRRRLASPFGLPTVGVSKGVAPAEPHAKHSAKQAKTVRAWARSLCGATERDERAGRQLGGGGYELIDYSSFVRRPRRLVETLYRRHFHRPVPREVLEYIDKHLPSASRGNDTDAGSRESWQFQYGTVARNVDAVDRRWHAELRSWEQQAIEAGCELHARHN